MWIAILSISAVLLATLGYFIYRDHQREQRLAIVLAAEIQEQENQAMYRAWTHARTRMKRDMQRFDCGRFMVYKDFQRSDVKRLPDQTYEVSIPMQCEGGDPLEWRGIIHFGEAPGAWWTGGGHFFGRTQTTYPNAGWRTATD